MLIRIAFLGFGTVGRALNGLLERRREQLAGEYGLEYVVTGIASRRTGWRVSASGVDASAVGGEPCDGIDDWLRRARADVVFEATPLDPHSGQPALDYLRAVLEHGAHAISANKGPVVHGYRALTALAAARGRSYAFEAAVMDGAPVFSLVRDCLPAVNLRGITGVFTSTATVVLEAVEQGLSFDDGVAEAQRMGIAEADPSYDVDGWDSAVKVCAVANVLLGADLRPADGALGAVRGATLAVHYEADVFPGGLTVVSHGPDPVTTAYGMVTDMLRAVARGPMR